jgi:phosphatidylserine decarboxylase
VRRQADADDLRARRAVLGEPGDSARRAEPVRAQRAVLVGATIVGSMATVWHGVVNPKRTGKVSEWTYADQDIRLTKGEEMGRFLLGSTIVMLFQRDTIAFNPDWAPERSVRLGEAMGDRPA